METVTRSNDTYSVIINYDNDLTSVDVFHIPTGISAIGHSRRMPEDIYDREIGRNLAYFRAFERLSHKITKYYKRLTI